MYPDIQRQVDGLMLQKGYDAEHWKTLYFPGESHTEDAWKKRFDIPLVFLLVSRPSLGGAPTMPPTITAQALGRCGLWAMRR